MHICTESDLEKMLVGREKYSHAFIWYLMAAIGSGMTS